MLFVFLTIKIKVKKIQTGNGLVFQEGLTQSFWTLEVSLISPKPAPTYLQVVGDEDLASFLDHGLRLQLLGGELALAWVEDLLPWDAGQRQVRWVGLVADGDLDGVRVDGAGSVSGVGEAWGGHRMMSH